MHLVNEIQEVVDNAKEAAELLSVIIDGLSHWVTKENLSDLSNYVNVLDEVRTRVAVAEAISEAVLNELVNPQTKERR